MSHSENLQSYTAHLLITGMNNVFEQFFYYGWTDDTNII